MKPIVLNTDSSEPEAVWARVERELDAGRTVRLSGALVAPLIQAFGSECDGCFSFVLLPHSRQLPWLYRARDVLFSAIVLLGLAPLLALLALIVKLSSPGPVFHTAVVVGQNKKQFVWRKFRSMVVVPQAEDENARREQFRAFAAGKRRGKVIDPARVTRAGAVLRKYSLDELPQLWNVLKGDMALVGPRPCLPYEAEMFPAWAARRFDCPPGLTGVWQIAGRSRVSLDEGLAMDVAYTLTRSFWQDARLVVFTLPVLVRGEGGE